MVMCCKDCSPCCAFCIYVRRKEIFANGVKVSAIVDGCKKHSDEHHQSMARGLGYCKDFHCCKVDSVKEEY